MPLMLIIPWVFGPKAAGNYRSPGRSRVLVGTFSTAPRHRFERKELYLIAFSSPVA